MLLAFQQSSIAVLLHVVHCQTPPTPRGVTIPPLRNTNVFLRRLGSVRASTCWQRIVDLSATCRAAFRRRARHPVAPHRYQPLDFIDQARAHLLPVCAVEQPRARIYAPCVNGQEQFWPDQCEEFSTIHVYALRNFRQCFKRTGLIPGLAKASGLSGRQPVRPRGPRSRVLADLEQCRQCPLSSSVRDDPALPAHHGFAVGAESALLKEGGKSLL